MSDKLHLVLRVPPTINHYYGHNGGRPYLTKQALGFRHDVAVAVEQAGFRGHFGKRDKLIVKVKLHLAKGGDIDNRLKPLLDALEHAELFPNDRQVCDLRVIRAHPVKGGRCEVTIWSQ